jgi:hypothetical protein
MDFESRPAWLPYVNALRFDAGFSVDEPGNDGIKKDCIGAFLAIDKELRIDGATWR